MESRWVMAPRLFLLAPVTTQALIHTPVPVVMEGEDALVGEEVGRELPTPKPLGPNSLPAACHTVPVKMRRMTVA